MSGGPGRAAGCVCGCPPVPDNSASALCCLAKPRTKFVDGGQRRLCGLERRRRGCDVGAVGSPAEGPGGRRLGMAAYLDMALRLGRSVAPVFRRRLAVHCVHRGAISGVSVLPQNIRRMGRARRRRGGGLRAREAFSSSCLFLRETRTRWWSKGGAASRRANSCWARGWNASGGAPDARAHAPSTSSLKAAETPPLPHSMWGPTFCCCCCFSRAASSRSDFSLLARAARAACSASTCSPALLLLRRCSMYVCGCVYVRPRRWKIEGG